MNTNAERLAWAMEQCSALRLRHTPVRDRVLACLADQHLPVTLETVTRAAELRGHCDPATVYRTLMLFVDRYLVRQLRFRTRFSYFVLNAPGELFHYLVCTHCGTLNELPPSERVQSLVNDIGRMRGVSSVEHELGLFGLCPACQLSTRQETPATKLISRASFTPPTNTQPPPPLISFQS